MSGFVDRQLGVHVGRVLRVALFTPGSRSVARLRVSAKVVGIVAFNTQFIQDD